MPGQLALLIVQVVLAALALRLLGRAVLPAVGRMRHPAVILDVWAPLVLVIPMAMVVGRSGVSVRGVGAVALSGPVACGWAGLATALLVGGGERLAAAWPAGLTAATWSLTGLVLLMVAAANEMEGWVGNAGFAALAILMWVNSDVVEPKPSDAHADRTVVTRAALGLPIVLAASLGQGAIATLIEPALLPVSAGLLLGFAVAGLAMTGMLGADASIRAGGWAAVYGVLLALGVLALTRMVPSAVAVLLGARRGPVEAVADGFGFYAIDAVALVLLGPAAALALRRPGRRVRWAGAALLAAAVMLAAWRLGAAGA